MSFMLLLAGITACRKGPDIALLAPASPLWFFDSQKSWVAPPPADQDWQNFHQESLHAAPDKQDAQAWLSFALPEDPSLHYLVITRCTNVIGIFQDQQRLLERDPQRPTAASKSILPQEPFLIVPRPERPSRLILKTVYLEPYGYWPNCRSLTITDRPMALYKFLTLEIQDIAAGSILFFICVASLLLYAVKRDADLLFFSLATGAGSLVCLLGSDVALVLFAHAAPWRWVWHLLLAGAPIPFLLFLEEVMPDPLKLASRVAWLNAALVLAVAGLFFTSIQVDFPTLRRVYYHVLFAETLLLMYFAWRSSWLASPYALRLGVSLGVLALAGAYDLSCLLVFGDYRFLLFPWALIVFGGILASMRIQQSIQNVADIQRARAQLLADRNRSLQAEVAHRTADLHRRSSELEQAHEELAENHESLATERENVAALARDKDAILSRIADLRNDTIPKIFQILQQLHTGWDDRAFIDLKNRIHFLTGILEPAARQYEKNRSISHKKLLVLDADRRYQRIYRMAIGASRVALQIATNLEEFYEMLQKESPDVIGLRDVWVEAASEIIREDFPSRVLVMSSGSPLEDLETLRQHPGIALILPLRLPRTVLQQLLLIHLKKLLTQDLFGIEKYIAWGFELKQKNLSTVEGSDSLLRELDEDLDKMGLEPHRIGSLVGAARCLFEINRTHILHRKETQASATPSFQQLRFGFDASFAAVSLELQGRLLNRMDMIDLLAKHHRAEDPSGSLPSLSRLLQLSDALIINSDGDRRHELIALIFLESRPKKLDGAAYFHFENSQA